MATYINTTSLDEEKPTDLLPPAGFSTRLPEISLAPEPSIADAVKPVAPAPVNLAPTPKVAPTDTQLDAQDRHNKIQKQLEQSVHDSESFYKGKDLSFNDDPRRAKALIQNDLYIDSRNAVDIDAGSMERDVQRKRIAVEDFDGRGADDEMTFNAEVNKKYQDKRSAEELNNKLVEHAFNSAIIAPEEDNEIDNQKIDDYLESIKNQPGYNKKKQAVYSLAYKQAQALAEESIAPFRKELNQMINSAKVGADPLDLSFEVYDKLQPQDRARFEDALVIRARALNPAERKTFFANMGRRYGETFFDFGTQMSGGLELVAGAVAADEDPSSPEALKLRKAREFYRRIKTKLREDYNPIQSAFGGNAQDFRDPSTFKPMWWEKMTYEMPGVAGTSLVMAVPVVGFPAMGLAMTGQAQELMYDRLVEKGMSEDKAIEISSGLAPLIMIPQMAAEYVGYKLLFGKLPFFRKALDKMGDRITNVFLRFGSKALAIGTAETGIELLQDATSFAIQDIANALAKDTYGVQWLDEGTKKGVLAPLLKTSPEIFVTMLPLTLLGTVNNLSNENRNKTFRATPRIYREAVGITDIDNAKIESAPGPNSLNSAIENARKNMDGNSLKAIQAREFLETELALAKQISRDMDALGIFKPRFTFSDGKVSVFDELDNFIGDADNIPAAVAISREHTLALDDLTANSMSLLASQLQGAKLAQRLDPASILNVNAEDFNPAYATPEQIARFEVQVALRKAAGMETGNMARSVLGYSSTEFDKAGDRQTVNDIFKNGSIFSSFHETGHGLRNDALAKGRITRDDEIRIMRAFDALSFNADGSQKARGSQKVMFIPVGITDEQVTEEMREEAVSELFEVEILRFKGEGSYNRFGVSKAAVSRNLAAIAKQYPGPAAKFSALLSHFRGRWGVALMRVARLNKGVRDGEFDIADYEQFLDKIMGVSEQVQFDAEVQTDQAEMLGTDQDNMSEGDPFSLGYVPEAFSIGYVPEDTAEKLENGPKLTRYRAMAMIDGKLYPPMSTSIEKNLRPAEEIGRWMQSEERPDLVPTTGRNAGKFKLTGPTGNDVWAVYAPYFHSSTNPLNDQFSAAYKKPLVTVEIEIPANDKYQAEGSKRAVGDYKWNRGRMVDLSRYAKIIRVVPDNEVAQLIAKSLPKGSVVADNVVTPSLRQELENAGVKIQKSGLVPQAGFALGDITPDMLAIKAPRGITPVLTESLPMWKIPKVDEDSISSQQITNKNRDKFFGRLDKALAKLEANPELIGTAEGWVGFLREAGISGTVPMPPSGVMRMLTDPKGFIADMSGGYHGARTVPNIKKSADDGLASVRKMRKAIGKGKAPNLMVSVLTSLWGINSRSQPPISQEAMWLRLVSDQRILDELKLSIDGNFTLNSTQWTRLVEEVRRDSMWESGTLGNGATTNANAFHMMLEKYNGKWDRYTATYAAADASTMNRGFWTLLGETGPVGIKNKVQRFIGITFGIPGVVLDRWQYVQFWLPTLMEAKGVTDVQDYWEYDKNGTAGDPLGIYDVYGGADANQLLSMAMAEAIDLVMNKAIQKSPELQAYLGDAADAGGLHWHSWNAIKNEAVGHSSLDLTYDLQKKFKDKEIKPADVLAMFAKNEYFTSNNENEIRITRGQITSRIDETKGKNLAGKIAVLEATRIENIAKAGFSLSDGQFERSVAGVYGRGAGGITAGSDARFFPGDVGELNAVGPGAFSIDAFHGTPNEIEGRMSLEYARTGSGRMTYGYGLYVSGDKKNSEIYTTQVTGGRMSTAKELAQRALRSEVNQDQAIKSIRAADVPGMVEENRALIEEAVTLILENKVDKSGNLYTIKLNVNDEDLLDYDKPFGEQSEKVKALLLPLIEERREFIPYGFEIDQIKGQGMISLMERTPGEDNARYDEQRSSLNLKNAGIPGMRFRVDSRGVTNYVIYDESVIEITEKNGLPVTLISPASTNSFSLGKPFYASTNVHGLRVDKTAWADAGSSMEGAREIVSKYYKIAKFAGIDKDSILIPVPSTLGKNVLPDALAERLAVDFGNVVEKRVVGVAQSRTEAKKKLSFFAKEQDAVVFAPTAATESLRGLKVTITEDVHNTGESWIAFANMLIEAGADVVGVATLASSEQRMTSPRDIQRLSGKIAAFSGESLDVVEPLMDAMFDGTFKQLFNKAEAVATRSSKSAIELLALARKGDRGNRYKNPLRSVGESEDGLLGDEQKPFAFSIGVEVPLANAMAKMVGEEAFEYRQDGMTIDEKKEQVQNLAFSLTHDDLGLPLVPGTQIAIIKQKLATAVITNDLRIPFLGDKVLGFADFAAKMQVLRNPAFETFYCVAMQGDNSIAAYAVTSRIPHSAAVGMNYRMDDNIYDLRLFLKAHGADGYYLAHNHPSGVPTPSRDDIFLTGHVVAQLGEFEHRGHIIINHDKFAVIESRNKVNKPIVGTKVGNLVSVSTADLPNPDYTVYDFTPGQVDQFADSPESGIGKPLQSFYYPYGTTPDAYNGGLATQIKKVVTDIQNPDMIMGIVTNIRLNVVAYLSGTIDDFASITSKQLQDYGSKQGGTKLFLHAKETNVNTREALDKAFVPMLAAGMISDLMVENSSGTQLTSLRRELELMGKFVPDNSFYGRNEAKDAKPILVQNGFSIGTMFSGGRVVEGGFAKPRVTSFAREYDSTINDFANESFDTSFVAGNVEDFDFDEIALDPPLLVSASPPCPNFSKAKRQRVETVNDMNCAKAVARMIKSVFPFAVTIENTPDYRGSKPFDVIVDALKRAGYNYEVLNIDAADYGAAQSRKRMLIRAVREGELPAVPAKSAPGDWYPLIEDLIADAEETTMPQDERRRLDDMIAKGRIDPSLPILSQGSSAYAGTLSAVNSGNPSTTILANNAKPRIYLPDGTAKSVTPRMIARIMGLPDTFKLPSSFYLAKRILGNGIHSVVTSQFIEPLMDLPQATQFPTYNPEFKVDTSRDAEVEQKVASMQGTSGFQLSDFEIPEILSEDAMSRMVDPKRRTQMMTSIATAFNNLQLTFDRISLLSKRKETKYELKQAARAREELNAEMATEKIWANYGDLFFNDDLTRLKAQPLHALFADPDSPMRGLLKSPSAWRKGRRNSARSSLVLPPEFNGSDNVSRSVFGGERMPDQAAKDAYEAGLISGPYFDLLWDGLNQEQNTVYARRESLKKAQQQIREAKAEAKKEANEWLKTSLANQSEVFNSRVEIIRALRMYEAIRSALPVEIRGELGGMVALASMTSNEKKLAFLQEKLSKADVLLERYLRIKFDKEWLNLLKRAKPRSNAAGEVPTGKIAANSYEVFRVAESAMGLSFADGMKLADAHEAMADDPDASVADKIMHRAISGMVSLTTNWAAASAATREQAVVDGIKILDGGLQALNIKLSKRREYLNYLAKVGMAGMKLQGDFMDREAKRISITGPGVGKTLEKVKVLAWELMSYGEVVSSIFGKDNQLTNWLRALEMKASNDYEDSFQLKAGELEALFNRLAGSRYKGQQLRYKMVNDKTIKFLDNLGKDIEFTESQAVTYLLMERQVDGKRHLGGITDNQGNILSNWSYGDSQTADIRAQISDNAKELLLFLGDNYGSEYERINDVFMEIRHIRMPRHKLYAPIDVSAQNQSYGQGLVDPSTGMPLQGAGHPVSFKNRSSTAIAEPNFGDAIDLYMAHVRQMEHFISHAEFSRDAMAVLGKKEVRDAIMANAGADAFNVLNKYIQYFAAGGVMNASAGLPMARTLGVQLGNMAGASLVGSVSVLAMQSLQAGAALYKMPVGAYLKRLALVTMGRLDYGSAFRSEYIQRRLSLLPFVVRDAMNNLSSGKPSLIKYWSTRLAQTIGAADAVFTATTYAILYDYHFMLAQQAGSTSPELQATRIAEKITDEIAQPMRVGAKSWLEVGNSGNPAFRLLFNFATAPRQMLGVITAEAMDSETNRVQKIATVGKAIAITWGVSGILMTVLRTMMRDLRDDGEDEEVFDEKNWDLNAMMAMAATGPIGGLPFFGDVLEAAIYGVAEEYHPNEGLLAGAVGGITRVGNRWTDGNFELLRDAEALLLGAAPFSSNLAAAKGFVKVAKDALQIIENITSGNVTFD